MWFFCKNHWISVCQVVILYLHRVFVKWLLESYTLCDSKNSSLSFWYVFSKILSFIAIWIFKFNFYIFVSIVSDGLEGGLPVYFVMLPQFSSLICTSEKLMGVFRKQIQFPIRQWGNIKDKNYFFLWFGVFLMMIWSTVPQGNNFFFLKRSHWSTFKASWYGLIISQTIPKP